MNITMVAVAVAVVQILACRMQESHLGLVGNRLVVIGGWKEVLEG